MTSCVKRIRPQPADQRKVSGSFSGLFVDNWKTGSSSMSHVSRALNKLSVLFRSPHTAGHTCCSHGNQVLACTHSARPRCLRLLVYKCLPTRGRCPTPASNQTASRVRRPHHADTCAVRANETHASSMTSSTTPDVPSCSCEEKWP